MCDLAGEKKSLQKTMIHTLKRKSFNGENRGKDGTQGINQGHFLEIFARVFMDM